jgi:hypothetical protein
MRCARFHFGVMAMSRHHATHNYEKAGKALKKMSDAAEWAVMIIPNATDYVVPTTDFQRHADELVKPAKAKEYRRRRGRIRQAHDELRSMP